MREQDEVWMAHALRLAEKAAQLNEVPVGALLIKDQTLLAEGYNCPIQASDPSAHAEIQAIRQASQRINNYRLTNTTLYVTLEPCFMCMGAIIQARIKRLVFATFDPKAGAVNHVLNVSQGINHHPQVSSGILAHQAQQLLKDFFQARRKNKTFSEHFVEPQAR